MQVRGRQESYVREIEALGDAADRQHSGGARLGGFLFQRGGDGRLRDGAFLEAALSEAGGAGEMEAVDGTFGAVGGGDVTVEVEDEIHESVAAKAVVEGSDKEKTVEPDKEELEGTAKEKTGAKAKKVKKNKPVVQEVVMGWGGGRVTRSARSTRSNSALGDLVDGLPAGRVVRAMREVAVEVPELGSEGDKNGEAGLEQDKDKDGGKEAEAHGEWQDTK